MWRPLRRDEFRRTDRTLPRCNLPQENRRDSPHSKFGSVPKRLGDRRRLAKFFPPDFGIGRTLQHGRQFLFYLPQTIGAGFECRLVKRSMLALIGISSVHVSEICDFLAEVREVFSDISHLLNHTLYSSISLFSANQET